MDKENDYINAMLTRTALCFSEDEIEKVRNTTLAIAGLGGVGAITAELFARWGVKRFRLLDMDDYDESNMNRQLFATSRTIGRAKVDVAEERIKEINPYAEIEMKIADRVDNENVELFVTGADFIIQNADHPSCKLFYLAAQRHKIPLVNGYATITGGRVQVFDYKNSDCSSIFDTIWEKIKFGDGKRLNQMTPSEIADFDRQHVHSTAPSINFVVNTVGCMIVGETLKMLTQKGKVALYPNVLKFDLFDGKMATGHSYYNFETIKKVIQKIVGKFGTKNN